jgi:hypothetical protein
LFTLHPSCCLVRFASSALFSFRLFVRV